MNVYWTFARDWAVTQDLYGDDADNFATWYVDQDPAGLWPLSSALAVWLQEHLNRDEDV